MADEALGLSLQPSVFTVPPHRSFADAVAAGLIASHGRDPLELARGRLLLPNNRAVRALTDAFVRHSGGGLLLPRMIPIGDPEIDDRIGGALDPADAEPVPPAIEPLPRLLILARLVRDQHGPAIGSGEAMRLAADLARTIDALLIEEVDPGRLASAVDEDLAGHWQVSLERLRLLLDQWPKELARLGRIDLADRRNRLLRRLAERWVDRPPEGFTIAAGITTSAPAIAAVLRTVSRLERGMVVLPGLAMPAVMNEVEWEALGPGEGIRPEETHPQYHLKLLLERIGVARGEVRLWRWSGKSGAPAVRGRAVAHAMTAADFSDKWNGLDPSERRLSGVRCAEFSDPAGEAQAIALAMREALETEGRTAALVTPDRTLATRVAALLRRWGIDADDSAGRPLSQVPAGSLLLAIAAAVADRMGPVATLGLLKHPLVRAGEERQQWLDLVRDLDRRLRGPRPRPGLDGLDGHFGKLPAWTRVRGALEMIDRIFAAEMSIGQLAAGLRQTVAAVAGEAAWQGAAGRAAGELLAELEASAGAGGLAVRADEFVAVLRQLLDAQIVRPAFGRHPRLAIWGLLEARLQQSDLMILGGLNEGVWPAIPAPDPWLAPRIRQTLGLPGLDFRTGLAAHDFALALGAKEVLLTRAARDSRSPTVASRFWLRVQAMTGGLARDLRLERLAAAIDRPGEFLPVERPAPAPPLDDRPARISVTDVDRLKADPFAFYAKAMLKLSRLEPVDAEHSAAWKGTAVHKVLEDWLAEDECDPEKLLGRARAMIAGDAIHPMLRALWQPRLLEAIDWIAGQERANRRRGRRPVEAEAEGETRVAGVTLYGKADRLDRLQDGGLAIVDYKTGKPPRPNAIAEGFALQLGLLGLIARSGGFAAVAGSPEAHEYWSLAKHNGRFGKCVAPDEATGAADFIDRTERHFADAAARYLTGEGAFTAKLNPAYAPYGDYDQLMRLEEWYGRETGSVGLR